jgi:hypothetical protein
MLGVRSQRTPNRPDTPQVRRFRVLHFQLDNCISWKYDGNSATRAIIEGQRRAFGLQLNPRLRRRCPEPDAEYQCGRSISCRYWPTDRATRRTWYD